MPCLGQRAGFLFLFLFFYTIYFQPHPLNKSYTHRCTYTFICVKLCTSTVSVPSYVFLQRRHVYSFAAGVPFFETRSLYIRKQNLCAGYHNLSLLHPHPLLRVRLPLLLGLPPYRTIPASCHLNTGGFPCIETGGGIPGVRG